MDPISTGSNNSAHKIRSSVSATTPLGGRNRTLFITFSLGSELFLRRWRKIICPIDKKVILRFLSNFLGLFSLPTQPL